MEGVPHVPIEAQTSRNLPCRLQVGRRPNQVLDLGWHFDHGREQVLSLSMLVWCIF